MSKKYELMLWLGDTLGWTPSSSLLTEFDEPWTAYWAVVNLSSYAFDPAVYGLRTVGSGEEPRFLKDLLPAGGEGDFQAWRGFGEGRYFDTLEEARAWIVEATSPHPWARVVQHSLDVYHLPQRHAFDPRRLPEDFFVSGGPRHWLTIEEVLGLAPPNAPDALTASVAPPPEATEPHSPTGVKYDGGKLDWTLLPFEALEEVVKVLQFGVEKYARDNWRIVDDAENRYERAGFRHRVARLQGEETDPESGCDHLAHEAACLLFQLALKKNRS
jgi:hypothetical protein